jgi:lipid-A-disaccharide synthase-like uncharacterized protein
MRMLELATGGWALVMAMAPIVQIRRMRRSGSSRDVSIAYWLVLLVGFALWIAYGFARRDAVLVLPNAAALLVGAATVAIAARLPRR